MADIIAVETSLDEDLAAFSHYLWQQRISHRVVEHANRQLVLVGSQTDAEQVVVAYRDLRAGYVPEIKRSVQQSSSWSWLGVLLKTPVTALFVVLSVLGYLLVYFDRNYDIVSLLTFFDFEIVGNQLQLSLNRGEYWRLITPVFLHFSILHIVFNSLWLWDLGRRIERLKGSVKLFGLIIVMGMGSNIAQSLYAEASIFGGMSGVIYGLLGYGWVWSRMVPEQSLHIPNAIVYFMLTWMVLCMFGISALLGGVAVANAAHVGGLMMGIILGIAAVFTARHHHRL